jgi:modulator of FtsH protease
MNGFTLAGWDNFFVACAGASAALVGLVFVALSINLSRILAIPGLAARAGESVIPLGAVLIVSLLALVPVQSMRAFAEELTVFGGFTWAVTCRIEYVALRSHHFIRPGHIILRLAINQPANLAVFVSGLSLLLGFPGGLSWLAWGVVLSFGGAMINAWILLVEILR